MLKSPLTSFVKQTFSLSNLQEMLFQLIGAILFLASGSLITDVYQNSLNSKGQIKSEWIYEIINFPKNDPKNLKDICPKKFYSTEIGRNPSIF